MPAEQFNTFVSGLPVAAPLVGSEPIPCIQAGASAQTTPNAIRLYTPTTPANWSGAPATLSLTDALDRLAAACVAGGNTP